MSKSISEIKFDEVLREYRVLWVIDVYAASPRDAAQEAQRIQRSYGSDANVFDVREKDTVPVDNRRIDLSISAFEAANTILIEACSKDMENTLTNDRLQREQLAKNGFEGFGNMTSSELVKAAIDAGLAEQDTEVEWAIKHLS